MANRHGLSPERLARLTAGMKRHVEKGPLAGVVTLVCRRGEIAHSDALGYRDAENKVPMTRDTIFRLASMTKPVTSVAAMMLIEENRIRLTDPIGGWLPEFANPRILRDPKGPIDQSDPSPVPIRVRDLLSHKSGLYYEFTSEGPAHDAILAVRTLGWNSSIPTDEWIKRAGTLPLLFEPGTRWHYSISDEVLGVLIERASGMKFPDFLRTRIFEPLGMKDTGFWAPPGEIERVSVLYALHPKTGERVIAEAPGKFKCAVEPKFCAGGGGLIGTADDYMRFARMMLGNGTLDGTRLLSRKSIEMMKANTLTAEQRKVKFMGRDQWSAQGYGLGVAVVDDIAKADGLSTPGKFGWGGAHGTWWFADPREELAAVMLMQLTPNGHETTYRADFDTLVYQAIDD